MAVLLAVPGLHPAAEAALHSYASCEHVDEPPDAGVPAGSLDIPTVSADLYCVPLLPTALVLQGRGLLELRWPGGPFSVATDRNGRILHEAVISTDLPPASSLGPWDRYVAWVTTPVLTPMLRLSEVPARGRVTAGTIGFNKFTVLITAEAGDVSEPTGPYVLRAQSPSQRIQPADFLEFALGATPETPDPETPGGESHTGHHMAAPDDPWGDVPMPEGVTMLPSLMRLRPEVSPWLPEDPDQTVVDARPRELLTLADGDSISLEAIMIRRRIGDRELLGYGFNGQIPGPLIWVPEKATITVGFKNSIEWPTAIHWHGIRLENRYDGVPGVTQEPILPGESFRYEIHFPDPGIYWYHPHHREEVQQDMGLAGNLVAQPTDPEYFSPAHREEVLMLDDLLLGEHGLVPWGLERATHALMGRFGNTMLLNGGTDYRLSVETGSVVRFFLTNASNTRTFNLRFGDAAMKLVGTDVGNFEREERIDNVVIGPAERYVVHVRFDSPGDVPIINSVQGIDHIGGRFVSRTDTMGWVTVGSPDAGRSDSAAAEAANTEARIDSEFDTLRGNERAVLEIAQYREHFDRPVDHLLELEMNASGLPLSVERLMQVDSAYFHPLEAVRTMPMMNLMATPDEVSWILREPSTGLQNDDIRWNFRVGEVVKLRIVSVRETLHQMNHPIHIHGQRFLVLAVNGTRSENLAWKDTVLVPAGGSVDLLLELTNPGQWMLHCHIAEHLEAGMKMVFSVN